MCRRLLHIWKNYAIIYTAFFYFSPLFRRKALLKEEEESGAIESNEKELIENVFEFNNNVAEDLMIHRTDMVTLSLTDSDETILSTIRESGLSRFPVYQDDVDDIVGTLSTREYLLNARLPQPLPLKDLLRPA